MPLPCKEYNSWYPFVVYFLTFYFAILLGTFHFEFFLECRHFFCYFYFSAFLILPIPTSCSLILCTMNGVIRHYFLILLFQYNINLRKYFDFKYIIYETNFPMNLFIEFVCTFLSIVLNQTMNQIHYAACATMAIFLTA